jgi:hypothetical protein
MRNGNISVHSFFVVLALLFFVPSARAFAAGDIFDTFAFVPSSAGVVRGQQGKKTPKSPFVSIAASNSQWDWPIEGTSIFSLSDCARMIKVVLYHKMDDQPRGCCD